MLLGMISTNVFFSPIFYLLFFWDSQPMIYSYRSLEILLQIPKALLLFSVMSFSLFSPPVFLPPSLLLCLPTFISSPPPSSSSFSNWMIIIDGSSNSLFPHCFHYAVKDHQLCFKFKLFHFSVLKFPFRSFSTLSKSLFNSSIFHLCECVPSSQWEKL